MTGPVGSYYSTGFKPISLSCATDTIRSAPKGTGSYKIGGYFIYYKEIIVQLSWLRIKLRKRAISKYYGC